MLNRQSIALTYIGFGSIISQILLLRALLTSFYGNELSIGIIFSTWLIWTGLGSITGNKLIAKKETIKKIFPLLIAFAPVILILQIIAVKLIRWFFPSTIGVFLTFTDLFISSFIILSLGCFVWGILFTLGAKLLPQNKKELWFGVNKAYFLESLGSVIGGLLFSFLLSSFFTTLQIAILLLLIGWIIAIQFIDVIQNKFNLLITAFAILIFISTQKFITKFEHTVDEYQWKLLNDKLTFICSQDTKYQNISLLKLDNQYSFYVNGKPAYSIPNTYSAELFAHTIMIHKAEANSALVIGGGFNGILYEILKYPSIKKIDYIEIDPTLVTLAMNYLPEKDKLALNDNRVTIHYTDGRNFVRQTKDTYDVIILNTGDPSTANQNRFFTLEFFEKCKKHLSEDGIIAFSLQSSSEYMSKELRQLNGSIFQTMRKVFNNALVIPGDRAIFIGTPNQKELVTFPDSLAMRFEKLNIQCEYFTKYTFWELMLKDRIQSINKTLATVSHQINTDANPIVYFFDLQLWNKLLHDKNYMLDSITPERIFTSSVIIIFLLLLALFLIKISLTRYKYSLFIIISLGGFIGMALNLLLILNFQQSFGSIYELVGLMIAGNIFGLAAGSILSSLLLIRHKPQQLMAILIATMFVTILLIPIVLVVLIDLYLRFLTVTATIFCGSITGMLYGLTNRYYLMRSEKIGSIYAFDIFGSSAGALLTCSILLPLLGINNLILFLLLLMMPVFIAYCIIRKFE